MKKIFTFSLLLLLQSIAYAQSGKLFTVDRELSSSMVNDVYQDSNGLIWIATEDGLNRYDGSKFTSYKQHDKKPHSLLNNYVRVVLEDRKGHLLIGFFNGLQHYDYATDTFKDIPLILLSGDRYASHVLTILERKNGDVLIGTSGQGLLLLKSDGEHLYGEQISQAVPSHFINYLYEDKAQNLWVSTQDKGLFRLGNDNIVQSFSESRGMPCSNITSIAEDSAGNLYVGSLNKGLFKLDKDSDSFSSIPLTDDGQTLPINVLLLNNEGTIYIGTEGKGMKVFDPISKKISETNYNVTALDFSRVKVNRIIEDDAGNIWAGLFQKGVLLLPKRTNNFKYIGQKSVKADIIGSNAIIAVLKDHQGTLWLGTDGDGIYGIGKDGKQIAHFQPSAHPNSVPATVMAIFEDSNHDLWIGSYLHGMAKLDRKTGECEYVKELLDHNSEPVQRVFHFEEDDNKQLWIGTMGSGLFQMDLTTNKIIHYNPKENTSYSSLANTVNNGWIDRLLVTSDGKLYTGTYDGLGCLDIKTGNFVSTFGTNRLLKGNIIYALHEDVHGTIWIGTSKGLMYIDQKTKEIHAYTMENGLPSNVICAIRGDRDNNLWISTSYGISKMDLQKHTFINYYSDDGLQGNEFSKGAAFVDADGQIIFGGINGITYFHPNEIKDQGRALEVRITDFYIHDQAVKKGMKSGSKEIISSSILEADTFHLSHEDNSFSIEFSAMEFNNPERITYMYSMGDDQWIKLRPGTNNVTFNNLAPGTYHFRVKAEDYNTSSDAKEIVIAISPAWYLSAGAKMLYCLVLLVIIYLVVQQVRHRYRTKQKMLEHIHAKQINEAKLQFFINIAHEIRTPMSLIISPLKKLMNKDKDSEYQKDYHIMHRNSERILLLINQLMDIRKIDKGQMRLSFREIEIISFISDLCAIFEEQMQSKHIALQFHHTVEKLNVWVDPVNFDKTVLNVLANALKYTPENGKIDIRLNTGEDKDATDELKQFFEIIIADSGIGIHESELEQVFECFYQTQNTTGNFSEGTGIGLHLTRSIVQLHYGTIRAENNTDGPGCRFIMRLPLGHEHLKPAEIAQGSPLIQKTAHLIQPAPFSLAETDENKATSKSKHRVLIVEDDAEIRKYICEELGTAYQMMACENGKEALSLALKETPDLIISDIMMPKMDGITLCRKIKQHVKINHVPVILLTAKSEDEDNLEGLDIGADAYIVKPFNMEILSKTVQNIIWNREILRNNFCGNQQQEDKIQQVSIKSADEKLMTRIMDVINENISNPALNVEMLASEIGISRVHLHRKTKALTNQSTRDLIRNIRLQQAGTLLASKNVGISEVAFAVGFTSLATFSNSFKEFYGVPPTTFMENHENSIERVPQV